MKLSNFAIPYPILGIKGAFNDNVQVRFNLDIEHVKENFVFKVTLSLDDPTILGLIKDKRARYAFEIDCVKTYFRKVFKSLDPSFEVEIPKVSLVGRNIPIFLSVVVEEDITEYQNDNFNKRFYENYKFNLTKGDMLAFFGQVTFNADIKYNELKALGSIMDVKPDANSKFTYFDFSGDLITIFLPQSEYENFRRANNHTYSDITHASIVQCALISALTSYKEYSSTLWAQTLKQRVLTEPKLKKFSDIGELSNKDITEMVSVIMVNPNQRLFEKLNRLMSD